MELTPGAKLGPYEIVSAIGRGGMGEVWLARDPRLGRDVAIKTSAQRFSDRFEREARSIAALNHPNVCTLYDVGPDYLVMEFVDGSTLADRIAKGPIPLEEALPIARQIADALEAAHEKGIVHRDLKPANVKVRPDGSVKVLDFGLAKMPDVSEVTSDSPTMLSAAGMILGTASYMAPEQARGKNVDKRADIFAFGAMLYEMLTGKRLFAGEDVTEILASVIRDEPNLGDTPASVRRLISECLQKDPRKRLRDIGDAWKLLDAAATRPGPAAPVAGAQRLAWLWPALAGLFLLAGGALAFVHFRATPPAAPRISFEIPPPAGTEVVGFALSPDGRKLEIGARKKDGHTSMWLRRLDSTEMHELPGTTDTDGAAWSPDSQAIAFLAGGSVQKIDIAGGSPQNLAPYSQPGGISWGSQDTILFGSPSGSDFLISRVAASGGEVTAVTGKDSKIGEMGNGVPFFLPDGVHFLYLRVTQKTDTSGVYIGSTDVKPGAQSETRLLDTAQGAVYAAVPGSRTGYLFFMRGQALMAQPFDAHRMEINGAPVQIADHVGTSERGGDFSASNTGVLSYLFAQDSLRQLTWYDRGGKVLSHVGEPAMRDELSLSPDGTRVAEGRLTSDRGAWVVWQLDLTRGISSRLTFEQNGGAGNGVWSPDGKQIVYAASGGQSPDIYLKPANGATQGQMLFHSEQPSTPLDWSHDGRFLILTQRDKGTGLDLWVVPMQGEHKPAPYLVTQFNEGQAQFSPDGHWVLYTSDETGTKEVYVRPFPGASGGKWQISNGGGNEPRWRRDGKELFYVGPDNTFYAVNVTMKGDTFQPDTPRPLFRVPISGGEGGGVSVAWRWDISSDGQRFLINVPVDSETKRPVTMILNWKDGLK